MLTRHALGALAILASAPLPAMAHDFWISPSTFQAAPGSAVAVELRVGVSCPGDVVMRKDSRIDRFDVSLGGAAQPRPIEGKDGTSPAGSVTFDESGLATIVYAGRPAFIELAPADFEAYLKEEGLEWVIDERRKLGEAMLPGREDYSRRCRSLVRVGEAAPGAFDAPSGLDYEIVALHDLGRDALGTWVEFRVLRDAKPLAGALVRASPCQEGAAAQKARSDENGVVRFNLNKPGPWLVASVHMTRLDAESKAQWQSRWASLTFSVSGPVGEVAPGKRDVPMPTPITDQSPAVPTPPKP